MTITTKTKRLNEKDDSEIIDQIVQFRKSALKEMFNNDVDANLKVRAKKVIDFEKIANNIREQLNNNYFVLVYDHDQLIGFGAFIIIQLFADLFTNSNAMFMQGLYVIPEYRNKGIGTLITNQRIEYAKNNNINKIFVESTSMSKNNNLKLGFINDNFACKFNSPILDLLVKK